MSPIEPYLPYISRSPRGERGLKSLLYIYAYRRVGRSPHGERGLKFVPKTDVATKQASRSPHGERGLKSVIRQLALHCCQWSLSSRRAWIEILQLQSSLEVT